MKLVRLRGLVRKEVLQVLRDPSALLIAFLLPVVLLVVDGFGLSLDARKMAVTAVVPVASPVTQALVHSLAASPYLAVTPVATWPEGEARLMRGEARGILVMREDFARRLRDPARWPAPLQLVVSGTDPNTARILEGYVTGALGTWAAGVAVERRITAPAAPVLEHRYWFNPELRSADFIVPGVIALVMSMTGTLLTSLIVAREWERGTMESMLASPASLGELTAAKIVTYFVLGLGSMATSMALALWLFEIPYRGGILPLLCATVLFLVFALALGLFISTLARNQFVAAQVSFMVTMLPALMLSGLLFDIASMPAWLQLVTFAVPARYLVSILQTLFLAGTIWPVILPNLGGLAAAAGIAVLATLRVTRRRLD